MPQSEIFISFGARVQWQSSSKNWDGFPRGDIPKRNGKGGGVVKPCSNVQEEKRKLHLKEKDRVRLSKYIRNKFEEGVTFRFERRSVCGVSC